MKTGIRDVDIVECLQSVNSQSLQLYAIMCIQMLICKGHYETALESWVGLLNKDERNLKEIIHYQSRILEVLVSCHLGDPTLPSATGKQRAVSLDRLIHSLRWWGLSSNEEELRMKLLLFIARLYCEQNDDEQAVKLYHEALGAGDRFREAPDFQKTLLGIANLYARRGDICNASLVRLSSLPYMSYRSRDSSVALLPSGSNRLLESLGEEDKRCVEEITDGMMNGEGDDYRLLDLFMIILKQGDRANMEMFLAFHRAVKSIKDLFDTMGNSSTGKASPLLRFNVTMEEINMKVPSGSCLHPKCNERLDFNRSLGFCSAAHT